MIDTLRKKKARSSPAPPLIHRRLRRITWLQWFALCRTSPLFALGLLTPSSPHIHHPPSIPNDTPFQMIQPRPEWCLRPLPARSAATSGGCSPASLCRALVATRRLVNKKRAGGGEKERRDAARIHRPLTSCVLPSCCLWQSSGMFVRNNGDGTVLMQRHDGSSFSMMLANAVPVPPQKKGAQVLVIDEDGDIGRGELLNIDGGDGIVKVGRRRRDAEACSRKCTISSLFSLPHPARWRRVARSRFCR